MYLKYYLVFLWIIEIILALEMKSKISDVTAFHVKKGRGNFQEYFRNGNKSRMVPKSEIQYDQVPHENENSSDHKSKVVNDVSRSKSKLDIMSMSDDSSRSPISNFAENPKSKESDEPNLNSDSNGTVEVKHLEPGKNIRKHKNIENRSQESPFPFPSQKEHKYKYTKNTFLSMMKTARRNGNQNLCISAHIKIMTMNYLYECRTKEFKNFACIGEDGKLEPCIKYISNKQSHDQLCIKKMKVAHVIPCNRHKVESLCFPATNRKGELIPCEDENLRVCYRSGYGLVNCKSFEEEKVLSLQRRSIQDKEIDPRNVQCSDCEVDIFMEVFEGSTPNIDIKIRPLNETIPHQEGFKDST